MLLLMKSVVFQLALIYSSKLCDSAQPECGIRGSTRIVGGQQSKAYSWPWMAALTIKFRSFNTILSQTCGGSVISDKWVLTAAHCFQTTSGGSMSSIDIVLGENIKGSDEKKELYLKGIKVVKNNFSMANINNDIALIQLSQAINFDQYPHIRPICLPTNPSIIDTNKCTATGWGRTVTGGRTSNLLLQVDLPVLDNKYCQSVWFRVFRPETMTCAGTKTGGKDICQGDSGGPLNCPTNTGVYTAFGISSFGATTCGSGIPSVFTRVYPYIAWIRSVTGV